MAILIIIHSDEDFRIYHQPTHRHFIAFLLKWLRTNIPAELMQQQGSAEISWNLSVEHLLSRFSKVQRHGIGGGVDQTLCVSVSSPSFLEPEKFDGFFPENMELK